MFEFNGSVSAKTALEVRERIKQFHPDRKLTTNDIVDILLSKIYHLEKEALLLKVKEDILIEHPDASWYSRTIGAIYCEVEQVGRFFKAAIDSLNEEYSTAWENKREKRDAIKEGQK